MYEDTMKQTESQEDKKGKGPVIIQGDYQVLVDEFDPTQLVTWGSNFMSGNGYLGYRGTFPQWKKDHRVACIVTDTYDNADGKWTELCNSPNGLYLSFRYRDQEILPEEGSLKKGSFRQGIDIHRGKSFGKFQWVGPDSKELSFRFERFALYNDIHVVAQRVVLHSQEEITLDYISGIDGDVWSLNGEHLKEISLEEKVETLILRSSTSEKDLPLMVGQGISIHQGQEEDNSAVYPDELEAPRVTTGDRSIFREGRVKVPAGGELVFDVYMSVFSGNDTDKPQEKARQSVRASLEQGYDSIDQREEELWEALWDQYGVLIESDGPSQLFYNFNAYHNIIATPAHTEHLPVGARGLSCQAYQGAAFWDQEIFNLPMYLHTNPEVAKNLLMYRYKTLDGARRKAKRLGYEGAFYAWVSGDTGDELCPDYFFVDVLTGRKIRNHFNDWQIHVSPDIAYTVWLYVSVTGDREFLYSHGAEIIFEVARFIRSHAYFKKDKNRYEMIRLLGPDEYHENVDNNLFTNMQCQFVLEKALETHRLMNKEAPARLGALKKTISLEEGEIELWEEMAGLMYIREPDPQTSLIEQFDGYFNLERILPKDVQKRLKDENEYWGWPNGIAVSTQVIKQADLLQLFLLHPDKYPSQVIRANYDYYEPMAHHRSSLSPSVHAIIAAWCGKHDDAYRYFHSSATIDLYNTNPPISGGTFIGGIHTAACGALWQVIVYGFAGASFTRDLIHITPRLPKAWRRLAFPLIHRGQLFNIEITHDVCVVKSDRKNKSEISLVIGAVSVDVDPGETAKVTLD